MPPEARITGGESTAETILYGSSLRVVPVEITLARAAERGRRLGITRVTDTTRLDRIGIPVFAGIRPDAMAGSLCVNAGKGVTVKEAEASAWMEAIEFALAEPGASTVSVIPATVRDVLDGNDRPDAILDLCPILDMKIPRVAPLLCVPTEELLSGRTLLVPAELGFYPAPKAAGPPFFFGANTTGLASGNTLPEAMAHGLAEVIERDIRSFRLIRDTSLLVPPTSFPPGALALWDLIRQAGLELSVRYQPNVFDLPYFDAVLYDPEEKALPFLNGGTGCHPHRSIALIRAICEAAQSRLSMIHGGRDDVDDTFRRCEEMPEEEQRDMVARLLLRARCEERQILFDEIVDWTRQTPDLSSCYEHLVNALLRAGMRHICRIVYTAPEEDLQVVKMIVPKMEDFESRPLRVGKRLRDYAIHG